MTQRTFSSGELSPALHKRADLARYHSGLAVARNVYVMPQGGVQNRPGTQFVGEVKDSSKVTRLIEFTFNSEQTYIMEFCDQTIRFYKNGGRLLLDATPPTYNAGTTYAEGDHVQYSGVNYHSRVDGNLGNTPDSSPTEWHALEDDIVEIPSPWQSVALMDLDFTQSGDVVTIVHRNYRPRQLIRLANDQWKIVTLTFSPEISSPGAPTCTAYGDPSESDVRYRYQVRALGSGTNASDSTVVFCSNVIDMSNTTRNYNTISWDAVAGATSYEIYIHPPNEQTAGRFYLLATLSGSSTSYVDQTGQHGQTSYVAPSPALGSAAGLPAFTGESAAATTESLKTYKYKITAISDTGEQSTAGAQGTCDNNSPFVVGDRNELTWTAVTGASEYYVYSERNGVFGYIGKTSTNAFTDDGIVPDVTTTPPVDRGMFASANNYPACVEFFEQRLFLGGTETDPSTLWASRSNDYDNMTYSSPAVDSDSLEFTLTSKWANQIYYLMPLSYLLAITDRGALAIRGQDGYLSPTQPPDIKLQGTAGSTQVGPVLIHRSVLYVDQSGRRVYEVSYDDASLGFNSADRSILSEHLLKDHGIVDWVYAEIPHQVLWAVRDDGVLLSFTYHREHEVFGWCRHDTDGEVESVASIRENNEDAVYMVVKRNVDGSNVRYVEKLDSRRFTSLEDAFFVDCGLTYDGSAATSFTGLDHLEGKTVVALADGFVRTGLTVSGGAITLPVAASKVHVGLPYTSEIETLAVDSSERTTRGKTLSARLVTVSLYQSRGGEVSSTDNEDDYLEMIQDSDTATLYTGDHDVIPVGTWSEAGKVRLRQADPLPMTVLAITPHLIQGRL